MRKSEVIKSTCTGLLMFWSYAAFTQPANDDCIHAISLLLANSEEEAVLVDGDTRGATASTSPDAVCSETYYTDDIWYKFTTPAILPDQGFVIKAYFNNEVNPTDLPHVGMAVYKGCDLKEPLVSCYVDDDPELNNTELSSVCLTADQEYLIRIWSGGPDSTTEGTFRIGVFINAMAEPYLWWESFGGGLEVNGWTTEGSCAIADSNANGGWTYLPDGLVDQGAYLFKGAGIQSYTLCDGAVGVDSDYNDNGGIENNFGGGPCPTPGSHILTSPVIYSGAWQAAGLSVSWTQALRQFQSTFFFAFRTRNADSEWTDWNERQINTEHPTNGDFVRNEIKRFTLPGAIHYDSLQLRFAYNDNYYVWAIDDVKVIPHECSNSVISSFYAIPPFAQIPAVQASSFPALADMFNTGACPITNSILHCMVVDVITQDTIYFDSLFFGTIEPDSFLDRRILPSLINLPGDPGEFKLIYTLTQDSTDFNPHDNEISILFRTGGNVFALEDGYTRSVAVANGLYDTGAPPSYAYGNYFRPVHATGVQEIHWGVNNPDDMAGQTVQIYLLQWSDLNGNHIAEPTEREVAGFADYTFTGNEGENVILSSTPENINNPGEPVIMHGGKGYIAMIEYQALSDEDPTFFMLASEARDYTPQQVAMDTAIANGLAAIPSYFSVLGWSPDGYIANIDYEVKELNPNDNRIFFGNDIVPVVRIVTYETDTTNTNNPLPSDQHITVFPNPTSGQLQVKLEFTVSQPDVHIRLVNALGQTIITRSISNTLHHQLETFDVASLASGAYHLQVRTASGQRSIPVVILH